MIALTPSEIERFWSKVDRSASGCWPWKAEVNNMGYGRFCLYRDSKRISLLAHRTSFFLTNGIDPLVVRHDCDNPPCCNPACLRPGTQADNIRDALERARLNLGGLSDRRADQVATMLSKIDAGIKWCPGCAQFKAREEFHRNRTASDGLQGECIPCRAGRQRSRRSA